MQSQRSFSLANAGLWDRARPPEPSEQEWCGADRDRRDSPRRPQRARRPAAACGAARRLGTGGAGRGRCRRRGGHVVALGPGLPGNPKNEPDGRDESRGPDRRIRVTVILAPCRDRSTPSRASRRSRSRPTTTWSSNACPSSGGRLPIGRHPLEGTMALATVEELLLAEVEPSVHVADRQPEDDDFAQRCPHDLRGQTQVIP